MRVHVLKSFRLYGARSAAILAFVGFAGCSSDTVRFNDGFYTGAVPTAPLAQAGSAQPYPGGVDSMNTGGIAPASTYGASGYRGSTNSYPADQTASYPTQGTAPQGRVQSQQLPPPPAASYHASSSYGASNTSSTSTTPEPVHTAESSSSSDRSYEARNSGDGLTRGAPPSSLQEQAAKLATPQPRPYQPPRQVAAQTRANQSASQTRVATLEPASFHKPSASEKLDAKVTASAEMPKEAEASKPVTATPSHTAEKESRPTAAQAETPKAAQATSSVKEEVQTQVAAIAPSSTGISSFRWPVQGRVLNRYGDKVGSRRNDGLNISVPRGTPIKASENGVVIYAGDGLKEFGNTVLVKHDNGLVTVYGNADSLQVKRGETVKRGQEIAKSGMSGDTDVPQLHFEVRKNSAPVDPSKFLE